MTFYTYMRRTYGGADSPEGDFAEDLLRDKESFPRNSSCKFTGWHDQIRNYLSRHNACRECLEVFEKCWTEYVKREERRLERC